MEKSNEITVMETVDPKDFHYYFLEVFGVNQHIIFHRPYMHINIQDPTKMDPKYDAFAIRDHLKNNFIQCHINYADYSGIGGHFSLVTLLSKETVEKILNEYGCRYALHELDEERRNKLDDEFKKSFNILVENTKEYLTRIGEQYKRYMKAVTKLEEKVNVA